MGEEKATSKLSVRVSEALMVRLKIAAVERRMKIQDAVAEAIRAWIDAPTPRSRKAR